MEAIKERKAKILKIHTPQFEQRYFAWSKQINISDLLGYMIP